MYNVSFYDRNKCLKTHVEAVGELSHQVGERHLGAPRRRARLVLDVLDVAGKDPHLQNNSKLSEITVTQ